MVAAEMVTLIIFIHQLLVNVISLSVAENALYFHVYESQCPQESRLVINYVGLKEDIIDIHSELCCK